MKIFENGIFRDIVATDRIYGLCQKLKLKAEQRITRAAENSCDEDVEEENSA